MGKIILVLLINVSLFVHLTVFLYVSLCFIISFIYITVITDNSKVLCGKCNNNIPKNLRIIKCNSCVKFYHVKCCDINHSGYNSLIQKGQVWLCHNCKITKNTSSSKKTKKEKCNHCKKLFFSNSKPVNCNVCNLSFHLKCVDISNYSTRQVFQEMFIQSITF